MTASREFFNGLFETLTGRGRCVSRGSAFQMPDDAYFLAEDGELVAVNMNVRTSARRGWYADYCVLHGNVLGDHSACALNLCLFCTFPVTNGQVQEGEAHAMDEQGRDDQEYAHDECVREARHG